MTYIRIVRGYPCIFRLDETSYNHRIIFTRLMRFYIVPINGIMNQFVLCFISLLFFKSRRLDNTF